MTRIELDRVCLTFRVRRHSRVTFKEYIVRRLFREAVNPYVEVRALQDVSLRFRDRERVGIIGPNGAGKSTLLRVVAGVYPPTQGKRVITGRVSSLFDIALGFESEANGWDNMAYRGYLQGETPRSVRAKMQEIAEFSELGRFLDMPVRYYSTGMLVRLAFSIATAIEPEILLVDEVLGAGDLAFQQKARQRMHQMMARARLIVVVSHDLNALAELCDTGVWLDHGRVRAVGAMNELIAAYTEEVNAGPTPLAA